MARVAVFVNTTELYYAISKKYNTRKLNYSAYKKWLEDLGEIVECVAYGTSDLESDSSVKAHAFIAMLKAVGYTTKFRYFSPEEERIKKRFRWDTAMTVDIMNIADRVDMVVIGTNNRNMDYLIHTLKTRGTKVVVFGAGIPTELKKVTRCIEIPESMLDETSKADGPELSAV